MKYLHPHYLNIVASNFAGILSGLRGRAMAYYWGVKLGKGSLFVGRTIFRILPHTEVVIGRNAEFRSSHASNLIGVYSPCMISTLKPGARINIGDDCGLSGTVIASAVGITIGNNVRCGANTLITDTDWHYGDKRAGKDAPVIIGDNVWLGYGVKVLKGVTIGENSLIGAGSVVTKSIPANCIVAGNPCRILRYLENLG